MIITSIWNGIENAELEKSPGFDKDNWPSHPDSEFIDSVNSYYGIEKKRDYSIH